jgi:hypothetical protein
MVYVQPALTLLIVSLATIWTLLNAHNVNQVHSYTTELVSQFVLLVHSKVELLVKLVALTVKPVAAHPLTA